MKAAVLTQYGHFEWKEVPEPKIRKNEVLVRTEYAGICGSDVHVFHGDFKPRTQLPLIPGHEFGGIIIETGTAVKKFKQGDRVTVDPIVWCGQCAACQIGHYPACTSLKLIGVDMDGGFGEAVAVPESMLYSIPSVLTPREAALVEIYSIGFHACNRAQIDRDDTVAIWGAGRVGQSILQAVRTKTSRPVFCIDVLNSRLSIARKAYPDSVTVNVREQDPVSVIYEMTKGRGVDVAFESVGHAITISGRPNPVQGCIQCIRGAGTVCVLGLGDKPSPVLTKELIWKEARIVTSRVSHGEFSEVIQNLEQGTLKPEVLISAEFPGSEVQTAFERIEKEPDKYLKILLRLSGE
jgi:threonine dehydrogenase-like Zn-dependent dehydrogenase